MLLINYYFLLAVFSLNLIRSSIADALKECDHGQMEEFYKTNVNGKQSLFSHVSYYERPLQTLTFIQIKRLCTLTREIAKKENEMRLRQERRARIFREFLAPREPTSFHRDFHTIRY
jgi:hypothetical protein